MVYAPVAVAPDISQTALAMCAYCAFTRRHERFASVFSDRYSEELFRRAAIDGDQILGRLKSWSDVERFICDEADGDLVILRHVVWRRRWIADQVKAALADGVKQVVIFGSGLDTLALRLRDEFPAVVIFEIDKPAMLAMKQRLVDDIVGESVPVRYVPLDLAREYAASRLLDTDYDPKALTLFLAEAVMEYLPPSEASAVFEFTSRYSAPGSRFIFTFFSSAAMDSRSRHAQAAFSKVGEPILFTMSPATLDEFLSARGLRRLDLLTPQYVREHYLDQIGMRCAEMTGDHVRDLLHICVAETVKPKSSP
jgi:methyltransferase (TIGR00027 family)